MEEMTKQQWIYGDSLADSKNGFPKTPAEIAYVAGDAQAQAHANIVACDDEMRMNYAINHVAIGQKIYPFLYSEFTPDGGRYTLLINESEWVSAKPVPPIYELAKSIAHIPLGVWSIIARYTNYPHNGDWIQALADYNRTLAKALESLADLNLNEKEEEAFAKILKGVLTFTERAVQERTFQMADYSRTVMSVNPEIVYLQNLSAKTQVDAFTEVLCGWRERLGEEEWKKLYVVVSAQWTLSTENVHQLIIANCMASEKLATENLFVTSVPLSGIEEARNLCGRIVGDRVMSYQTLSAETERGRENIYSLSTSRDLISKAAEDVIGTMQGCPHMKQVLNGQ